MDINQAFGLALRELRILKGKTQEDFAEVSSRTYISSLERGMKSPTIEKITNISNELDIYPMTLLVLTYAYLNQETVEQVTKNMETQIRSLK